MMNPPPSNRADEILNAALKGDSIHREAFIIGACGEDAALLAEVRALLEENETMPTAYRAIPAAESLTAVDLDATIKDAPGTRPIIQPGIEREGERIGRYKLLQEIGEGGFGTVWMAEQVEPVTRRVALKIIKLGMDTREVVARFEAERQALAMMDHPNIAKVLDAGATDKGRPFFVMELVKGVPITEFCDARQLGTRERLELFIDVCSAINHAHQKGIIHRDIKPSNVMITLHGDKAVVKVIDFGIAKATQGKLTDKTLFTRFEQFIGTPVYMSPEQASLSGLDIDTRSDIYALGILLYELLTGKPPFDSKSLFSGGYDEMRRIIREVEPSRPSLRLNTVVGEERTMLARARQIEPAKVGRLVEPDLDWIVMKAIDKDRTRRYETANAFARDISHFLADEPVSATPPSAGYQFQKFARRNKAALRVGAGIVIVLVVATVVSTWQAIRATQAEKTAFETLAQVAAERDAKELARRDAENISKFLGEVFQSPDPTRDGRTITVAETLDNAAKKLETDLAAQPVQRAKLQTTLGNTYLALGLARQAIPLQEKARNFLLSSAGPNHPDTLLAMHKLALSYATAGRLTEALKLREEVLGLRRKVLGERHPDTLSAMNNLALSCDTAGRQDEALKLREEVLTVRSELLGPEHPETLKAMQNLALSYHAANRRDEGLKLQEEVLPLSLKVNGLEHPDTLLAMNNLASSYSATDRLDEALKLQEEALKLRLKVNGPEHPDTLLAKQNLANSYAATDRLDEAIKLQEEVLKLRRKVSGAEHPDTLSAIYNLANSCQHAGRKDEALRLREELLTLNRKVLGPAHAYTLSAISDLADSYMEAGRMSEATPLLAEISALKSGNTTLAMKVASLQAWFGKDAELETTRKRMLDWSRDATKPDDLDRVAQIACLRPISDAAMKEATLSAARRAMELGKDDAVFRARTQMTFGMAEYRAGHYSEAVQALLTIKSSSGTIADIAAFYRAMCYSQQKKPSEANTLFTAIEEKLKPFLADEKKPLSDDAGPDDLLLWLAYKEAKALIAGSSTPGN
jgi:serine/threonine protein kinase